MRKEFYTPKDKKECKVFTDLFKKWVNNKIAKSDMTSAVQVCQYLVDRMNKDLSKPIKNLQTIKNYLYGSQFPIMPEHSKLLNKITKIPRKVMQPDSY